MADKAGVMQDNAVEAAQAVVQKQSMLDVLNELPKVGIRLPVTDKDNANQEFVVPVAVNGVAMQIAQGDPVEVPAAVYEALKRTGRYDI